MAKIADAQVTFEGGEADELALARVDVEAYGRFVRRSDNFDLLPQGPARKRTGSVGVLTQTSARTHLTTASVGSQEVMVAVGSGRITVVNAAGSVVDDEPLSWTTTGIWAVPVDADSSGESAWIGPMSAGSEPSALTANGQVSSLNVVQRMEMLPSAPSGLFPLFGTVSNSGPDATVSLPTGHGLQTGDHVVIRPFWSTAAAPWQPNVAYTLGNFVSANGCLYECTTAGTSGTTAPNHLNGVGVDGTAGWLLMYREITYSYVSSVSTNSATLTGNAGGVYPGPLGVGDPSYQAFVEKAATRYSAACNFQERLVLAQGRNIHFSFAGRPRNFSPLDEGGVVTAACGFRLRLPIESSNVDAIKWLYAATNALVAGTDDGIYAVFPVEGAVSATNRPQTYKISNFGTAPVLPVMVGGELVYAGRNRRTLYSMRAHDWEPNTAADITLSRPYLFPTGDEITSLVSANIPHPALIVTGSTGPVRVGVYTGEGRYGWHTWTFGMTGSAGLARAVLLRTANTDYVYGQLQGGGFHLLRFNAAQGRLSIHRQMLQHLDFVRSRSGNSSAAIDISDTLWPPGANFCIIGVSANGQAIMPVVDSSNPAAITWSRPQGWETLTSLHWGWKYDSELIGLPLVQGSRDGTGQAKKTSTSGLGVDVLDTTMLEVSIEGQDMPRQLKAPGQTFDRPVPLFSGIQVFEDINARREYQQAWKLVARGPFPVTIRAVYPTYDKAGA